jgi:hypothetical protein
MPVRTDVSPYLLRDFGEPDLRAAAGQRTNHVYRFICVPSFSPPLCVVLTVAPDGSGNYVRKVSMKGNHDHGPLKETTEGTVEASQVEVFLKTLDREGFWTMDTTEPEEGQIRDGSAWTVEAVRDGNYHVVFRNSPSAATPLARIGRTLLRVTDSKMEGCY